MPANRRKLNRVPAGGTSEWCGEVWEPAINWRSVRAGDAKRPSPDKMIVGGAAPQPAGASRSSGLSHWLLNRGPDDFTRKPADKTPTTFVWRCIRIGRFASPLLDVKTTLHYVNHSIHLVTPRLRSALCSSGE